MPDQIPAWLRRGSLHGFGYGVAVTTVHLAVGMGLVVALGQPPHTLFAVQAVLMELVLAAILGVATAPVQLASARPATGQWAQIGVLAAVWLVLEYSVAVDPSKPQMYLAGPLVGGLLYAAAQALVARGGRNAPWYLAGGTLSLWALLLAVPEMRHASRAEPPASVADRPPLAREDLPDVLFLVMDTVRAESCSTYGYARETTPVLTSLASEGLRFDQATAPGTWSLPAHASLFTGTFPSIHNCHGETGGLGPELPTLAEQFRAAGYETRCFSANPHISATFGLTRGFESCDKAWARGDGARQFTFMYRFIDLLGLGSATDHGGGVVVGNIAEWMASREEGDRPAFVFVNFLEAHFPFHQLPDEFRHRFGDHSLAELKEAGAMAFGAQTGRLLTDAEVEAMRGPLIDLYDGGVRYTDKLVGDVVDLWREAGTLDDTVVVVLADHGEVVGEHKSFGHLAAVVEEDLHVPFVLRYPPRVPAGAVVAQPVSTVGVFATLMDLVDLPAPDTLRVGSLMQALPDPAACADVPEEQAEACAVAEAERIAEAGKPVLAERYEHHMLASRFAKGTANGEGPLVNPHGRYRTYRSGPYKLVQHCDDGTFLFHLEVGETEDLAPTYPSQVRELESELLEIAAAIELPALCGTLAKTASPSMSLEETCALCRLGYMAGEQCEDCP